MSASTGAMEEAYLVMEDTVSRKTEKLKAAFDGLKLAVGDVLMPKIEEFVTLLTEKLKPAIAWLEENPQAVESFLKFGAIFAATGAVFLGVAAFIKLIQFAMIPALIRATIAMIALQASAGPAGWAVLAVEAGIVAGAVAGLKKLMDSFEMPEIVTDIAGAGVPIPSAQFGGIIPGPLGRPVPIIAHGGEQFLGVGGVGGGGSSVVNINVGLLPGDDMTIRKVARMVKEALGENSRRNTFGQVNQGYYYGRSSV